MTVLSFKFTFLLSLNFGFYMSKIPRMFKKINPFICRPEPDLGFDYTKKEEVFEPFKNEK